jgi:hypothetical protein
VRAGFVTGLKWARVGSCAARTASRTVQGRVSNGISICTIGNMLLCAATLAVLLVISGVEQNSGPGVEAGNCLQVLRSGCDRVLKFVSQCAMCGRWFHKSCGNVKAKMAENGRWSRDRCR